MYFNCKFSSLYFMNTDVYIRWNFTAKLIHCRSIFTNIFRDINLFKNNSKSTISYYEGNYEL